MIKTQRRNANPGLRLLPLKQVCTMQSGEGITADSIEEEGAVAVYGGICLLRRLDPGYSARFLRQVLVSELGQEEIEQAMIDSTFRRINIESIRDLRLPWPSAEKQRHGTEQLDVATEQVDALVAKARQLIEVMAERRTALISAAVTGQLPVDSYAG